MSVIGSIATVAVAIGALLWALGDELRGKRAIAFGIVLAVVGEVLARNGEALLALACTLRIGVGVAVIGAVLLLALLRRAWLARIRAGEPKLSKKRRVQGGP